mmetsp:Transcript_22582/g.53252  ORF Transcript_22582/g.53252 Transcript_22582/m.53252 type:complete len:147 (+) Transcript_22582:212-652(+)
MPLYFREIGRKEPQWLVEFFATKWRNRKFEICQQVDLQQLQKQWNASSNKLLARHVAVALIHLLHANRVLLLVVWQHDRKKQPKWNMPGGSVDRAVDGDWVDAAKREFQEEVNPAGLEEWSSTPARCSQFKTSYPARTSRIRVAPA